MRLINMSEIYWHYETLEIFGDELNRYHIDDVDDPNEIKRKLPRDVYERLIISEFNRVCEDRHYCLDFFKWKEEHNL